MCVFAQIWNSFNSRCLDRKLNIFEGVMKNWYFITITAIGSSLLPEAANDPYIPRRQQDAINKFSDLLNTMLAVNLNGLDLRALLMLDYVALRGPPQPRTGRSHLPVPLACTRTWHNSPPRAA
jgi:hypothetical protein